MKRWGRRFNLFIAVKMSIALVACGTLVGNPRKPKEAGDSGSNAPSSFIVQWPTIKIDYPSNTVTGTSLNLTSSSQLLEVEEPSTQRQFNDFDEETTFLLAPSVSSVAAAVLRGFTATSVAGYSYVNKLTKVLSNSEAISETGQYFNLGQSKNLSLDLQLTDQYLAELAENDYDQDAQSSVDYKYQAVICSTDSSGKTTIVSYIKWFDSNNVYTVFTQEKQIIDEEPKNVKLEIDLKTVNSTATMVMKSFGNTPDNTKEEQKALGSLKAVSYTTKVSPSNVYWTAVDSYFNEVPSTGFDPYLYITATTDRGGVGEVVSYSPKCPNSFDETASTIKDAGFCFIGRVDSTSSTLTATEIAASLERLKDAGIESKNNLKEVTFDSSLRCPVER